MWDREVYIEYTGEVFDIREIFDIKVINSDTGKEIKQTYATIKAMMGSMKSGAIELPKRACIL